MCCVSLYIFRQRSLRSSKKGKEISKKKKLKRRTCKSCGKICSSSQGCIQKKEFLGDPDCDDEPVVTSSRRRMSSALSTTSSGGASVCSGCSEASMDNDMSKSQIRSWLNEEEPHGAMVDWMKSDMMRRGVALSDARSQRSDTALSSKILHRIVYKGRRIEANMRGIIHDPSQEKGYMVGYLLKRKRKRGGSKWSLRNLFRGEDEKEEEPTTTSKRWQRRYFELPGESRDDNFRDVAPYALRYFSDRKRFESNPGNPRGVIDLRQIESIRIDILTMGIYLVPKIKAKKDLGVYAIRAESESMLKRWSEILEHRVKTLQKYLDRTQMSSSPTPLPPVASLVAEQKEEEEVEEKKGTSSAEYDEEIEIEKVVKKHSLKSKEVERLREILYILHHDKTQAHNAETVLKSLRCDNNPYDTLPFICQRFLRGRKFNVQKALKTMHEDVQWREEENIKELMHGGLDVRTILGCNPAVVFNRHPVVVSGQDREGRVVVYVLAV